MKRWFWVLVMVFLGGTVAFGAVTPEQWTADYGLYQQYLSATPKDYLAAVNITKKWADLATSDLEGVKQACGNPEVTPETFTGVVNNIYREVAQVLCDDYSKLLGTNAIKAAEYAIAVQDFFRAHPAIFEEFAAANQSDVKSMQNVLDESIRAGIMKTYEACAQEYSRLQKEKKFDEAAALSQSWAKVCSDWEAHNSPLPGAFKQFAGIDPTQTVDQLKAFEKDYSAWREAVDRGDDKTAFDLVNKWTSFEASDPKQAEALGFLHTAIVGGTPDGKTDWKTAFNAATYARLWPHDVNAYQAAIAAGKLDEAKALIEKWQGIFAGGYGAAIAKELGSDVASLKAGLEQETTRLSAISPEFTSETVASFKKDLDEYSRAEKAFASAEVGSEAWYNSAARGVELADKWSRLARENPALAAEIAKATGINLPQDADNVITAGLKACVEHSAMVFNQHLASGNIKGALDLVRAYNEYFAKHPRVKEIAGEIWGPEFLPTLERYESGLGVMAGEPAVTAHPTTGTSAETTPETETTVTPEGETHSTPQGTFGASGS